MTDLFAQPAPALFAIGDRVRILESPHVCEYLWGHTGTVTYCGPGENYEVGERIWVGLDEPAVSPNGTTLKAIGAKAAAFEKIKGE